jgi:hypothetical protein
MSAHRNDNFGDRLSTAAKAKTEMLARFRARPAPDSPEMVERQAALAAVSEAREARMKERQAKRDAATARHALELEALAAEEKAKATAQAALDAENSVRSAELAAEQKAARDARYAARRARKR